MGLIVVAGVFMTVFTPEEPLPPPHPYTGVPLVFVDAGHGGNDGGAKSRGVLEKERTLALAREVEAALRARGFTAVLTRRDDRYVYLSERVAQANREEGAAVFVSLHFNQGRGEGVETFYASVKTPAPRGWRGLGFFTQEEAASDSGETLAAAVQSAIVEHTGARDRGIRGRDLHVTRYTRMPAILVEGGFLSHPMEARLVQNDAYLRRIARGVADGVQSWWEARPHPAPPRLVRRD